MAPEGRGKPAIDTTRVYVAGMSNGGIMTHRLMCNADNTNYPQLALVAAYTRP